jgi:hypothetical protein
MLITVKKTETKEQTVEIELPAYYKWNHIYVKILNLNESIEVKEGECFFGVSLEAYQAQSHALIVSEGSRITEKEFLEAFHRVGEKVKRELIKAIETDGWKAQEQAELKAGALAEVETTQS